MEALQCSGVLAQEIFLLLVSLEVLHSVEQWAPLVDGVPVMELAE